VKIILTEADRRRWAVCPGNIPVRLPFLVEGIYMKKVIKLAGMIVSLAVCCFSISQVAGYYRESEEAKEEFQELRLVVEEEIDAVSGTEKPVSRTEQYERLHEENPDFAGWVWIEGTRIDYPVMHTPDRPDYYLKRNFQKEYSAYGVPYIAENCSMDGTCDNVIIYGHHMNDGSMFAGLMNYAKKSFYETHKVIQFDTLQEAIYYEVIAVFKTTVYGEDSFPFYEFVKAETESEFDSYISECKRNSLYEIDETAVYGEKLLTLSTCEYSRKNGRMVVVAKRID